MKAPAGWRRPACTIHVRHPLEPKKQIRCAGRTWEEAIARAEFFRALRRDLRSGFKSRRDVERELWAQDHGGCPMSLADAFAMHAAKHATAERTKSSKRVTWTIVSRLWPELGSRSCEDVDGPAIRELSRRLLEDGYAASSSRTFVSGIVSAVRFAAREGYTSIDRASRIWSGELRAVYAGDFGGIVATGEGTPRSRVGSLAELQALAGACHSLDMADRARDRYAHRLPLLLTCAYGGMRNGELAALGWGDFSENKGRITIAIRRQCRPGWQSHHPDWRRPSNPPKGGKIRFVSLSGEASQFLRDHRREHERRGLYGLERPVFPTSQYTWPADPETTLSTRTLAGWCVAAGLTFEPPLTPHSLRRSKAYLEHLSGATVIQIQLMLGHTSQRTTVGYIDDGRPLVSSIPAIRVAKGSQ